MLHDAIDDGDIEKVRTLLANPQIDINEPIPTYLENGRRTPLFFAMRGDIECFRLLVRDPRLNVNTCGPNAPTPLNIALQGDVERTLLLLLHPNIYVNRELYAALEFGGPCLPFLLKHNRLNVNQFTLHRLALNRYNPSTELFLTHPNLNINLKFHGKHPLDVALYYNPKLAELLLDDPNLDHPFVCDISILSRAGSVKYRNLAITCLLLVPQISRHLWLLIFSLPRRV